MYMLFEIQDKYIIMFGVLLLVILVGFLMFFVLNKKNKIKPISENERFEDDDLKFETNQEKIELKKPDELTDEQKKARAELEKVFNQMNADLQKDSEKVVDDFEREQEENAIISYQELIKQVKGIEPIETKKEPVFELKQTEEPLKNQTAEDSNDFINSIITSDLKEEVIEELPASENYLEALENLKPNMKSLEIEEERKPYSGNKTKFKTSEIISPIFGRQDPTQNNETFQMDEAYTAISQNEEQKQNAEFLQTLKEFRNNL